MTGTAARDAAREQRRLAKSKECAEWLKKVLKPGTARNKVIYGMTSNFSKDQINAAAIEIKVHEELRPEGKFWSLPAATGATTGV